ncbi:MAG: hypothetical protein JJU03_07830 [Idiomarina sp.]|nr:hypothetical protein [Idiomarina sp.]
MDHPPLYVIAMAAISCAFAAFLIVFPLKTLLTRRPVMLRSRYLFAALCMLFIPMIAYSVVTALSSGESLGLISWLIPMFYTGVLVMFWIQMRGFMVTGATDTYFRQALLASTKSLGLTTEESLSGIKVRETGEEIQVIMPGRTGAAQMKPLNKQSKPVLAKITNEMTAYFKNHSGEMNYVMSFFGIFAGLIMFAIVISMLLLFR